MNSTQYISNTAENGGAIYFDTDEKIDNIKPIIQLNNIIFENNTAKSYGGAIYSKYSKLYNANIESLYFINNNANIAGGAIYVPDGTDKKIFNISQCTFKNNKGINYGDDYTTEVSMIKLEDSTDIRIRSGEYIPLRFLLYDEYNKTIKAEYNIFSDISITAFLTQDIEKNENSKDFKYFLSGNICSFYNGNILNKNKIAIKNIYVIIKIN